ncbi:MAG: molybdopterin-dependent oxidoreductase [Chloroflexi bacterium]|nr:molybdopterin-dependent oxidoreductase [Chloroflexota bacterium]
MTNEITLTIDGREVKAQPGQMVLQAAMDAGIYVPYLCYYPGMKPYGACRMCVVEVENQRGTPASCTLPVAQGMVIKTQTPDVVQLRRGFMDLLLSEHPHGCLTCHRIDLCGPQDICQRHVSVNDRCVICPKNERCELKDTARHLQMDLNSPLTYNYRGLQVEARDPFYDRDYNLCIACVRCVRVCEEIRGDSAITVVERSGTVLVGTSQGTSLLESGCEFCGACVDVCPTGALVERDYKWEKAVAKVNSICPNCPVGCQMTMEVNKRGRLIRAVPDLHGPSNQGQGCFKGKFGLDFVNHRSRIKRPLVRRNGSLEDASWDDALDIVVGNLQRYKGGPFALIASPRGTNEDNYVAQKFARVVMASNNVDISSNIRPELVTPLGEMLGYAAGTNQIWELESSGCVMVVSSNATEEHNVAAVPIKKALKRGLKLIVIDPREVELTRHADIWLRPRPGSEATLIGGILRTIVDEGLDDSAFVAKHCQNVDELKRSLMSFDPLLVERETGLSISQIREAARVFCQQGPSAILYALDTLNSDDRTRTVQALVNLALITGNIGKPSAGLFPLIPGANEQGSKDVGSVHGLLPGYMPVADAVARAKFEEAWGSQIPREEGISLKDMSRAILEGRIKALYITGDSPNFANGETGDYLDALKSLEFLVVSDNFENELTALAHVVLPTATFAEKDGTYTNMERRVQLLRKVLEPMNQEISEWQVFSLLAQRMGAAGFRYSGASEVMSEIASLVSAYGGISHQRLEAGGIQWPCPDSRHPGTSDLYTEGFKDGKVALVPLAFVESAKQIDGEYPFLLATGRVLHQPDREMEVIRGDGLNMVRRSQIVEIHPEDATTLGIRDGGWVDLVSSSKRIRAQASVSGAHRGVVSVTYLFGELAASLDAASEPDPMLKVPGLPLVPVRLEKSSP